MAVNASACSLFTVQIATIRGTLARYLQLHDWDLVHDRFRPRPSNKDVGGKITETPPLNNLASKQDRHWSS